MTLSCSRLPRRLGGPQHHRRGGNFVHRTACAAVFEFFFGPKYLSEPSKQALAQPYTVIEDDLRAFARAVLKLCVSHRGVVAVPVLAPWRAPTCWGPVMSGNLQRRTNARERGRMQPLCKESRHVLILSKSGHKSRAAIARPIESSRPIETAYRSQPDPKSAARSAKKKRSSDTAQRNGEDLGFPFTKRPKRNPGRPPSPKRPNAGTQARSASTSASSAPKL